jgi:hypothetical protein
VHTLSIKSFESGIHLSVLFLLFCFLPCCIPKTLFFLLFSYYYTTLTQDALPPPPSYCAGRFHSPSQLRTRKCTIRPHSSLRLLRHRYSSGVYRQSRRWLQGWCKIHNSSYVSISDNDLPSLTLTNRYTQRSRKSQPLPSATPAASSLKPGIP